VVQVVYGGANKSTWPNNVVVAGGATLCLRLRLPDAKTVSWSFLPNGPESEQFIYSSTIHKTADDYFIDRSVIDHYDLIVNETGLQHAGVYKATVTFERETTAREFSVMVSVVDNPVCNDGDVRLQNCRVRHARLANITFIVKKPNSMQIDCVSVLNASDGKSNTTECRLPIQCQECVCSALVYGSVVDGSATAEGVATNVPERVTKPCMVGLVKYARTTPRTASETKLAINSHSCDDRILNIIEQIAHYTLIGFCGLIIVDILRLLESIWFHNR
jgi:hypothetical protein